jgi:hypothetical protein
MKRATTVKIAAFLFVVMIVSIPWVADTGLLIRLWGDRFDRDYNEERIKQSQPIIEDYFVKKTQRDKQLNVWSDTTESHVHRSKSYYTNGFGSELLYEIDYYKPSVDSSWLKKQLNIAEFGQLNSWEFKRVYYPDKGVDSYQILYRMKGESYRTAIINPDVGDSLFQTLK